MNTLEREGFLTTGKVIGYETKNVRVGGTWTWLDYPVVLYVDRYGEQKKGFIKFAKSNGRYFSLGREVEIIEHDNTLYYKHAMKRANLTFYTIASIAIGLLIELFAMW